MQHNHHCIVTFCGINWLIKAARPGFLFVVTMEELEDQPPRTILD